MKKLITSIIVILGLLINTNINAANPGVKKPVKSSSVSWTASKVTGSHSGIINLGQSYIETEGMLITGGQIIVDMNTIVVTDLTGDSKASLEGHLRSGDFFDVAQYTTATFDITGSIANDDGSQLVSGNLTIKGVTQAVTFTMLYKGNYVTTTMNIDRTKFGVRYGSGSFFDNLGDKAIDDMFELRAKLEL